MATSAIGDILSRVEDIGKRVSISCFEVFQEHVYDLLDPDQREVQVLEDSQGKVKLKGLSQACLSAYAVFEINRWFIWKQKINHIWLLC